MKLLKKAAAVLLAATMSLTMLTACGGGSGVGAATNSEAYTMEMKLIQENHKEPQGSYTRYITTNETWSYIEETYDTAKRASLQNIKTGEYYIINPTAMKAYKDTDYHDDQGSDGNVTTKDGTWTDGNGKTYAAEIITTTYTVGEYEDVETLAFEGGKPVYIEYVVRNKSGEEQDSELYKVTQYSRTANESKFDLSKYTMVTDRDELYK